MVINNAEIRINVPQRNMKKFKEVLLYILDKTKNNLNVGKTVLYKLLYFIDFNFYEKYEEQLIGAEYRKGKYGPVPTDFDKIIKDMLNKKEISIVEKRYYDYIIKKYIPMRKPDVSALKPEEKEVIDEVIKKFSNYGAKEISEYSHGDVPWIATDFGDKIDYELVFYRTKKYSVREYKDED